MVDTDWNVKQHRKPVKGVGRGEEMENIKKATNVEANVFIAHTPVA